MANDKIYVYNHSTGEEIVREMTDEEQAERDAEVAAALEAKVQRQAEVEAKAATKQAALEKLGLTEEEVKALLGQAQSPKIVLDLIPKEQGTL